MLGEKKQAGDACDTMSVRDVEGGETTPSFGHPSNVRRDKGGTAFGGERPPCIPPNRREGRLYPSY